MNACSNTMANSFSYNPIIVLVSNRCYRCSYISNSGAFFNY
jgi:hypothetical protein